MQRSKKIGSASAIAEYDGHLESFLATPKSLTTSFAPTINHFRSLREGLEIQISSAPTNNYCCGLKKRLEIQTFSTPTNNNRRNLREGSETQLVFTTSISFSNGFDIPEDSLFSIKHAKMGYVLRCEHCWYSEIKNLTPAICNLCKYIWKVILCMVLTSNGCLDSDI